MKKTKPLLKKTIMHVITCLFSLSANSQSQPSTTITNGLIQVHLYLPDTSIGYYRGTRFDWSGLISSLEYKSHNYYGQWFDTYDPKTHDAVMGPVEEFDPLQYAETPEGGSFVKIGVGKLKKPSTKPYSPYMLYNITDPGRWKIKANKDEVTFTHDLQNEYTYSKTVRLTKRKPELTLIHTLKNTSTRVIETLVYDHNFLVIDSQPTGPAYTVRFPTDKLSVTGAKGLGELAAFEGNKLIYHRDLTGKEQVYFPDLGAGTEMPYAIEVENVKTGAGVSISGDKPIIKMVYWSSSTTVSPEPYIRIKVAPGKTFSWKIAYLYYTRTQVL